jgi:hypothetical protein
MRVAFCRWAALLLVALALAVPACSHDLEKLQDERSSLVGGNGSGSGSGGARNDGSGGGGSGTSGGTDTGGAMPMTDPDACLSSCDDLPSAAAQLGLERCCRGVDFEDCGVNFGVGQQCLGEDVEGLNDDDCPAETAPSGAEFDGCCRPDGLCGLRFESLALGCVSRDVIPEMLLDDPEPIVCEYPCEADGDCDLVDNAICVEGRSNHDRSFCARACRGDGDCGQGEVCGINNNFREDRVDGFCQRPIGSLQLGDICTSPESCPHGICGSPAGEAATRCADLCDGLDDCLSLHPECASRCTQLCQNDDDCESDRPDCVQASIPVPSKKDAAAASLRMQDLQIFEICTISE